MERIRIALALMGLAIAVYLATYAALNLPLSCPNGTIVNCDRVLASVYAKTFGVPNSYFGILFFLAFLVLVYAKRPVLLLLLGAVGVGAVVYYVYLEFIIGAICLYCTAVHILVVALFILSLMEVGGEREPLKL